MAKPKKSPHEQKRLEAFVKGSQMVAAHPIFERLHHDVHIVDAGTGTVPGDGWAVVSIAHGGSVTIYVNRSRDGTPANWAFVLAHCLLHLALGHGDGPDDELWDLAADAAASRFLRGISFGKAPPDVHAPTAEIPASERALYEQLITRPALREELRGVGVSGSARSLRGRPSALAGKYMRRYIEDFGDGLAQSVSMALEVAADRRESMGTSRPGRKTRAQQAREWFMASYPLLGSLAASFKIVDDRAACQRGDVAIGAVDTRQKVIYINPGANLDDDEMRFVMAHELLHVGLRHAERCAGRDPYLWNVACDYVINHWLVEMGVGAIPRQGCLYDEELKGLPAEQIYDRIVRDVRTARKLATLRGVGLGDIFGAEEPAFWRSADGIALDEFYRRSLAQGLELHRANPGRGLLPAGLIEEINALQMPPIPWDVRLGRWFDAAFPPLARKRTYARPSRRQGSTPDIPRPSTYLPEDLRVGRTFAVILDTSGSMPPKMLGLALGAIASYAAAKEVPAVRLIFCDAVPYDQGYVDPAELAGKVEVKGRGGTVLQGAVDLLLRARDFPADGPLLIITDGAVERVLAVPRPHAYLMPPGARLPFAARGEVFALEE